MLLIHTLLSNFYCAAILKLTSLKAVFFISEHWSESKLGSVYKQSVVKADQFISGVTFSIDHSMHVRCLHLYVGSFPNGFYLITSLVPAEMLNAFKSSRK